jgi:hypothetical protein
VHLMRVVDEQRGEDRYRQAGRMPPQASLPATRTIASLQRKEPYGASDG